MEPVVDATHWKSHPLYLARRALVLLATAGLCTCPGIARAQEGLTLDRFTACQKSYCGQLVEMLNEPIKWHLVLDVSGSFGSSPEANLEKVLTVTRQLPIVRGDSFCLDSFDLTYHRQDDEKCLQELTARDIASLRSPYAFLRSMVEDVRIDAKERTDIVAAIDAVADSKACGTRCYYIFLTDGEHDPENSPETELVFSPNKPDEPSDFAQQIFDFVQPNPQNGGQLVRGLHFIIDTSVAEREVDRDWRKGKRQLRRLALTRATKQRVFSPTITLVAFTGNDPPFSQGIREDVDRAEGIFPCLYSPPPAAEGPSGRWPTVHGYPYPDLGIPGCPQWPQDVYRLSLPPALLAPKTSSPSGLELRFLAYGTSSASLTAELQAQQRTEDVAQGQPENGRATELSPIWTDHKVLSPPGALDSFIWRQYPVVVIPLKLDSTKLNGMNLPVEGRFELNHLPSAPEFLTLSIGGPPPFSSDFAIFFLERRGRLAAILALLFLAASILLLSLAARNPGTLTLKVRRDAASGEESEKDEDKLQRHKTIRNTFLRNNGFRARLDGDGGLVSLDEFRPYMPPELDDDDPHCRLGVILLGFLIYFVVWRHPKKSFPEPDDPFALDIIEDKARAKLVTPRTTWIPTPETGFTESRSTGNWFRKLRLRFWQANLKWGRSLKIKIKPDKALTYDIFLKLKSNSRVYRAAALFFHAMAAAAAAVAVWQFLVNADPIAPQSTFRKILGCGAAIFGVRMIMHLLFWEKLTHVYFVINRAYFAVFFTLLSSALILGFVSGGQTFTLVVLGVCLTFFASTAFLFRFWVRKRLSEGKSFHIGDILFDTFLSYGPLAS